MKKLGSGIIVEYFGLYLLCKMVDKPNHPCALHWVFPGGKVDKKETPFSAMVRETKEEVGLEVCPSRYHWITMLQDDEWKANFWLVQIDYFEYNNLIICDREFLEHKWLTKDKIMNFEGPTSPFIKTLLKDI